MAGPTDQHADTQTDNDRSGLSVENMSDEEFLALSASEYESHRTADSQSNQHSEQEDAENYANDDDRDTGDNADNDLDQDRHSDEDADVDDQQADDEDADGDADRDADGEFDEDADDDTDDSTDDATNADARGNDDNRQYADGNHDADDSDDAAGAGSERQKTEREQQGRQRDKTQSKKQSDTDDTASAIDYEKEYNRLLAPFKANGHDIQVRSIDEAISLMQQGAGFNKKMAALKPHLKTIKLLENSGINDPAKLNYLIDLQQQNPKAISKLLADSNTDGLDLDEDAGRDYVPTHREVSDQEIELDTVMAEIRETPTYQDTIRIVGQQWDTASRDAIANQPSVLKTINVQVANGIYGVISTEMERMRALGQLNGVSDLEAYQQIGARIDANGGFNHLTIDPSSYGLPPQSPRQERPASKKRVRSKQKATDPALNQRRKAASSTKASGRAKKADFNPLAMSDEEFSKQFNEQLM